MKDIKIGLAGFGTVGRGTWELLEKNKKKIEKSSKIKISIVAIADPDKSKFESLDSFGMSCLLRCFSATKR